MYVPLRHELSVHLMPQTFDDLNDLCTKAHDLEMHLSKRRSTQSPRQLQRLRRLESKQRKRRMLLLQQTDSLC